MNIEGSSINALFSSNESLENIPQTLNSDGTVSQEFADTLNDKIRQLKGVKEVAADSDNKESPIEFAGLFGNKLPSLNQLEEHIDLEDTLEALTNVMNLLDGVVTEEVNLEEKLATLIEKLEIITADIPKSAELEEKLSFVFNQVQEMKDIILNNDGLENDGLSLEQQSELIESQIESLRREVITIKEGLAQNNTVKLDLKLPSERVEAEETLTLLKGTQLKVLASQEDKGLETEKFLVQSLPEEKVGIKKEVLLPKQMAEQRPLGITAKSESESLLQQENAFRQTGQDNPLFFLKQNEKAGLLDDIQLELNSDKPLPKFATDIALLNKSFSTENKSEIPAMTKHFSHPEWNKEISERVLWMHKQAIPSAELRLNPRHLGPITIKVDVTQDQATVAFTAQHASVKEAIEAALPKLREMFSAQQLNLADVDVSHGDKEQRQSRGFSQMESGQGNGDHKEPENRPNIDHGGMLVMDIAEEIEAGRAIASNGILSIFA